VPDDEFNRVHAELRAIMADVSRAEPEPDAAPPEVAGLFGGAAPPAPAVPPAPPAPAPSPYAEFMRWLASHMAASDPAHRLAGAEWEPIVRGHGVVDSTGAGSLSLLQHRPDLLPAIRADIEAILRAKGATP
jgi:hypothetical protein